MSSLPTHPLPPSISLSKQWQPGFLAIRSQSYICPEEFPELNCYDSYWYPPPNKLSALQNELHVCVLLGNIWILTGLRVISWRSPQGRSFAVLKFTLNSSCGGFCSTSEICSLGLDGTMNMKFTCSCPGSLAVFLMSVFWAFLFGCWMYQNKVSPGKDIKEPKINMLLQFCLSQLKNSPLWLMSDNASLQAGPSARWLRVSAHFSSTLCSSWPLM